MHAFCQGVRRHLFATGRRRAVPREPATDMTGTGGCGQPIPVRYRRVEVRVQPVQAFRRPCRRTVQDRQSVQQWHFAGAVAHPASNYTSNLAAQLGIDWNVPTDKVRAQIVAYLKGYAAEVPQTQGRTVAEDRIAVTLL
jgi:hypothetical protein